MNVSEQITRRLATLPRDAQTEVLDFVEFLVKKYAAEAPSEDEAWEQASVHDTDAPKRDSGTR